MVYKDIQVLHCQIVRVIEQIATYARTAFAVLPVLFGFCVRTISIWFCTKSKRNNHVNAIGYASRVDYVAVAIRQMSLIEYRYKNSSFVAVKCCTQLSNGYHVLVLRNGLHTSKQEAHLLLAPSETPRSSTWKYLQTLSMPLMVICVI